jgi:hypothetical protein
MCMIKIHGAKVYTHMSSDIVVYVLIESYFCCAVITLVDECSVPQCTKQGLCTSGLTEAGSTVWIL